MQSHRQTLLELLRLHSFQTGDFTLASGQKSSYYLNVKNTILLADAFSPLKHLLWQATSLFRPFDSTGGMEIGSIPLTMALLAAHHERGEELTGFIVRKAAKEHGSRSKIEGPMKAGRRVVILEDVLTTGGSVLQAITALEEAGAVVLGVVGVVDRLQGAGEKLSGRCHVRSLFTVRDFGIEPGREPVDPEI